MSGTTRPQDQPGRPWPAVSPDGWVGASGDAGDGVGELVRQLRGQVADRLAQHARAEEEAGRPMVSAGQRRELGRRLIAEALDAHATRALQAGRPVLDSTTEQKVARMVFDALFSLAGLQPLLDDPRVETINANGADTVFVRYADGHRERVAPIAGSDDELVELVRTLAARAGVEERRFDRGVPRLSLQLPDGSRLFAAMAVCRRPIVSIRRHRFLQVTLEELLRLGTVDAGVGSFLHAAVRARKNLLVAGGTSLGKTTLLRALAAVIPPQERLVTIEDAFELALDADTAAHPDVVALQAREANIEGQGAVDAAELVRWGLRMSPDRVIVGEVRGPEVIPMLNAMSQGNDGSMGTVHASTSAGVFTKLAAYAVQAAERLPLEATNLLIASALHFVVHLDYDSCGRRVVSSVREVVDADGVQVVSNEVFHPDGHNRAVPGAPLRGQTLTDLVEAGLDPDLLHQRDGWWQP